MSQMGREMSVVEELPTTTTTTTTTTGTSTTTTDLTTSPTTGSTTPTNPFGDTMTIVSVVITVGSVVVILILGVKICRSRSVQSYS